MIEVDYNEYKETIEENMRLIPENHKLKEEIERLKRQIKIKDKWCEQIIQIGCDYDGYNDTENLKEIIDELVEYSKRAIKCDDKSVVYVGNNTKENILFEELKDSDKE